MISEKFWNTGIWVAPWCSGYHYCTTSFFHSTKPELWFCTSSYRGVSEIRNCKDLWQWSWLEIKLNAFHRLTILQKQFIIISSNKILLENLFRNILIVCLRWNLASALIRLCWIRWWCSLFMYWIENTLFGHIWSIKSKLSV